MLRFDPCPIASFAAPRKASLAFAVFGAVVVMTFARTTHAADDVADNYVEAPAVAARFPDPVTPIATPALRAGRTNFTSYAEMRKFLADLGARAPDMRMRIVGRSQDERDIPLVVFAHPPTASAAELAANGKPTVLVIGQQHGNEPAGGEAALALQLAGERRAVLDRVNVLIVPRANPDGAQNFKASARDEIAAAAGQGEVVVAASATPGRNTLVMLDPETGADKEVEVEWSNALEIRPTLLRARPYGYLLTASQASAAARLRNLGVTVLRVDGEGTADVERFRIAGATVARKDDVRRNEDDGGIRVVNLKTVIERTTLRVRPGDFFIPLGQPLANVAVAALEPDTQSSYAANYVLTFPGPRDPDRYVRVARVMTPLNASMARWDGY
jgi:hypothetical protein